MGFEVPVSGVDRGRAGGGRVIAAALVLVATLVAVGAATGGVPRADRNVVAATAGPTLDVGAGTTTATLPRPLPRNLTCRDVDRTDCLRIAKAALLALPVDAPDAVDATVWRSLLCNDSLECPPARLKGSVPLGSVIIGFADGGPRAAVNVVEGQIGPIRRAPHAWVVRWMPEPG